MRRYFAACATGLSLMLSSCTGGDRSGGEAAGSGSASSAATPTAGPVVPGPGGKIVKVDMITDETGNYFEPADFEVNKGDVIRFTLVSGVHNGHFVADSSPGARGLPPARPLLQLPGQTTDVLVTWDAGRYYYHCDPHALIGMIGHATVKN